MQETIGYASLQNRPLKRFPIPLGSLLTPDVAPDLRPCLAINSLLGGGQTKPDAKVLGAEKRFKYFRWVVRVNALAGIRDDDLVPMPPPSDDRLRAGL